MGESITLTRSEALQLLDRLWSAYELATEGLYQVQAMELVQTIELIEHKLWD